MSKTNHTSVSLAEICSLITDGKHGDCEPDDNSGFYFLSCKDVNNGKLNYRGARQITEVDFHDTHRRTRLEPGDILLTNSGTIGRMAIAPNHELTKRTTFQKSVAILKPLHEEVDSRFLYFALHRELPRLIEFAGGTAQKNLLLRDLRGFRLQLPDLPTQRKIAGILSAYDDLIENNLRRIKILEQMAQSLYREWFVHFRFPGHESARFVDSSLGRIPKGWEVTSLGELVEIRKGKNITKTTIREGSIPVVAGGLTPAYYHDTANTDAPVVTISASGANAGFVNIYFDDVWTSDCSFIDRKATPDVYYFFLMLISRQNEMTGLQRGSAQPHVYPKDIMALEALSASRKIRDDFTQRVTPLFESVRNLHVRNQTLRRTRDLLLPKLLSGDQNLYGVRP
jgi:type I restriction enzyme S subunit